jgi:putative transposase
MTSRFHKTPEYQRFNIPGNAHELTFSCYKRQPLFKWDQVNEILADAIERASDIYNFDVWAYVFIPEHVHLMIFPLDEEYSTSNILRSIKQSVSRKVINKLRESNPDMLKYLNTGLKHPKYRFWQDGGGYDRNYYDPESIRKQVDYIHANPVRRGFVDDPVDWKWSSAKNWSSGKHGPCNICIGSFPLQ